MNPLFSRFYRQNAPAAQLSQDQQEALEKFRSKLSQGKYVFESVPCICGNEDGKLIAERDRYALLVRTYLCKSCGILWTTPRMTDDSLTKFYEIDYRPIYVGHEKATDNFFSEQVQHGRSIYQYALSHMQRIQNPVVFDVGCGAGGTLKSFVEAGWSAFGCDLGKEYLQHGRDSGLLLEVGNAAALEKYGPANLVILSHVLEHLPNPLFSLDKIYNLLTKDGYLYIELPGIFNIHKTYGDFLLFLQNAHLYNFTLTTLSSILSRVGFKLVKGDEKIRALFKKDRAVSAELMANEYRKVLAYLYFTELNRFVRIPRS